MDLPENYFRLWRFAFSENATGSQKCKPVKFIGEKSDGK